MRVPARLSAMLRIRPGRGGTGRPRPVRVWPGETDVWLAENGVHRPRAARHALAALAIPGARGRYAARAVGGGTLVIGPVSALALRDAEAEIAFVFRVTPRGYGETPF